MAGNDQDLGMYAENQSASLLRDVHDYHKKKKKKETRSAVIRSCFVMPNARSYRPEVPLDHMLESLSDFTSRQICTCTAIVASDCALLYSRKLMVVMVLIIKVN